MDRLLLAWGNAPDQILEPPEWAGMDTCPAVVAV